MTAWEALVWITALICLTSVVIAIVNVDKEKNKK